MLCETKKLYFLGHLEIIYQRANFYIGGFFRKYKVLQYTKKIDLFPTFSKKSFIYFAILDRHHVWQSHDPTSADF